MCVLMGMMRTLPELLPRSDAEMASIRPAVRALARCERLGQKLDEFDLEKIHDAGPSRAVVCVAELIRIVTRKRLVPEASG